MGGSVVAPHGAAPQGLRVCALYIEAST